VFIISSTSVNEISIVSTNSEPFMGRPSLYPLISIASDLREIPYPYRSQTTQPPDGGSGGGTASTYAHLQFVLLYKSSGSKEEIPTRFADRVDFKDGGDHA
jgi:hypothetical protein